MTANINTIKGVTFTPPAIGRIMMGHSELRGNGDDAKVVPQKDDHFSVTGLAQNSDRSWPAHPITAKLVKGKEKLVAIPVVIAYNDPNLNLNNRYTCFDPKSGRTLCAGNGVSARRLTPEGVQTMDCPGVEACQFGIDKRCKNFSRFYVRIEGQDDELGVFVLRTTGRNSLERLGGRLSDLAGFTGGIMAGMPMMLTINAKTSAASFRKPFWYADLVQRPGMRLADAIKAARDFQQANADVGLFQDQLETAMRERQQISDFVDEVEDLDEWLSDYDMAAEAERNLQKSGLRGLDKVVAIARSVPAGTAQASSPEAPAASADVPVKTPDAALQAEPSPPPPPAAGEPVANDVPQNTAPPAETALDPVATAGFAPPPRPSTLALGKPPRQATTPRVPKKAA